MLSLVSRVFTNGLGDQGSIPGRVILKTQKMVLDASLLYTQHYKVRIRNWTRLHEFKSSMRLIAFHIALIPLGKV